MLTNALSFVPLKGREREAYLTGLWIWDRSTQEDSLGEPKG